MAWLDPRWFTWEALSAEWWRKDIRRWLVGVTTTVVVLILFCHPEGAPTAVYVDSVGIDVFLALLELQVLVSLALYRHELLAWLRKTYVSNSALGTVMRKAMSLVRYQREAWRGSFR